MDDLMKMMLAAMMLAEGSEKGGKAVDVCTAQITMDSHSISGYAKYSRPLIEFLGDDGKAWMEETSSLLNPIIILQTTKFEKLLKKKGYIDSTESADIKID